MSAGYAAARPGEEAAAASVDTGAGEEYMHAATRHCYYQRATLQLLMRQLRFCAAELQGARQHAPSVAVHIFSFDSVGFCFGPLLVVERADLGSIRALQAHAPCVDSPGWLAKPCDTRSYPSAGIREKQLQMTEIGVQYFNRCAASAQLATCTGCRVCRCCMHILAEPATSL